MLVLASLGFFPRRHAFVCCLFLFLSFSNPSVSLIPPAPPPLQLTSPMRPLCQTPPCPLWKIPDWSSPLLSFPLLSSFPPSRCLPPSPPSPPPPPAVTLFLSPRATSPTSWPRRWPTSRAWWRTWTPSPQRHEHALAPKHHTDRHTHNHTLSVTPHTHIQKVTHPKEKNTTKQYKTNQQNLRSQRLLDTKWLLIPTKKKKKLSRLPLQRKTKLPDWNVGITFSFFPRLTLLSLRKEIAMWGKKKWDNFIFIWRTILRDYELLKRKNKNKQTLVAFNRKIVNFFFSSAKMVVIFFCLFVCFSVPNTLAWDGWFSVKSKKYAGFWCMVLMRHSLHTVFVWLVFSLCILYIYWTVSVKWTLDFSLLLLFTKPTLFINLSFVFYPRVIWLFIGFFYVIVLFFT